MKVIKMMLTIVLLILLIPFAILGSPAFMIILALNRINGYDPNIVGSPKQDN